MTHRVVVYGLCRTKKTSNQAVIVHGRPMVFPSKDWREWVRDARITVDGVSFVSVKKSVPRLVYADATRLWVPLPWPLNCAARFYLTARQHGDCLGYLQGLADLLETRQVILNDRLLVSFDGSRCLKDGANPRVEVVLEPVAVTAPEAP